MRKSAILAAGVLSVVLTVTSCSGSSGNTETKLSTTSTHSDQGPSNMEALYEAAKDEGSVTWYSSADDKDLIESFEKAYPGVKVKYLRLPGTQIGTRFTQEREAGTIPADVLLSPDEVFMTTAKSKGWLVTNPKLPELSNWPTKYYQDGIVLLDIAPIGIAYNTDLVKPDEVPSTWQEAIDPKFKKFAIGDPRVVPSYLATTYLWEKNYGPEFLQKVADLKPTVAASGQTLNQSVAAGATAIALTDSAALVNLLEQKGAPIKFKEICPCAGSEFRIALVKGAEHPNAARLLLNYLLTKDGQVAFAQHLASPLGKVGTAIPIPKGYVSVSDKDLQTAKSRLIEALGIQ